jgi:hypothetical protein
MKRLLLATAVMLAALTVPAFAGGLVIQTFVRGTVTFNNLQVGCQSFENLLNQREAYRMAANMDPRYDCQWMEKERPLTAERLASDGGQGDVWPTTYAAVCVRAKRQVDKYGKEIPQDCFWVIFEKAQATNTGNLF